MTTIIEETTFIKAKNRVHSKLAAALTAGATSLTVTLADAGLFPDTYPFHLTIDDEIVSVTNRVSNAMTIVRAQQGTTAATHANKSYIALNITAKAISDLNAAVNTIEQALEQGINNIIINGTADYPLTLYGATVNSGGADIRLSKGAKIDNTVDGTLKLMTTASGYVSISEGQIIAKCDYLDLDLDVALRFTGTGKNIDGEVIFRDKVTVGRPAGSGVDFILYGAVANYRVMWDANGDTNGRWTFGDNDYGVDVAFRGATASNYMLWDASEDRLFIDGTNATLHIGQFSGASSGQGTKITSSQTAAMKVFADDGGADIGSGTLARAGWFRMLSTVGSQNAELAGVQGSVVVSDGEIIHNAGAVWGSLEFRGTSSVNGTAGQNIFAAVMGRVGAGSSVTLDVKTGSVLAGLAAMQNINTGASQTYIGTVAGLYIGQWPSTDDWPYGIYIASGATTVPFCSPGVGVFFIGDTANAKMTTGITINQAGADDELFAGKNSDTAHAMTGEAEADTFFNILKWATTEGGARIRGFSSATTGLGLEGDLTTDNTTKSTSGVAAVHIRGALRSGSTVTNLGANGNILAIQNYATTVAIVDAEGDLWLSGGVSLNGASTQAFALTATTGGEEAFKMTITDAATQTAGMNRAFVVDLTVSGAKSDTAHSEGISIDLTLSGNTNTAYGMGIWVTDSGGADHVWIQGLNIYLEDMGGGTVEHIAGLDIGINATNVASGRHTALRIRSHSGTPKSAIDVEAAFVVGLDFYNGFTPGDFSTADIRFHHGATLLDDGTNLTLAGANLVLGSGLTLGGTVTGANQIFDAGSGYIRFITTGSSILELESTQGGAGIVGFAMYHNSTTPADNDYLDFAFYFANDASEKTSYGTIGVKARDVSDGTEDARLTVWLMINGSMTESMRVENGIGYFTTAGAGSAVPTLFDDYDDALILREGLSSRGTFEKLEKIGVMQRNDNLSGWLIAVQPMMYLLAGGVYQNRARIDDLAVCVYQNMAVLDSTVVRLEDINTTVNMFINRVERVEDKIERLEGELAELKASLN